MTIVHLAIVQVQVQVLVLLQQLQVFLDLFATAAYVEADVVYYLLKVVPRF